jgi:Protein of unknown function (DUF3237)
MSQDAAPSLTFAFKIAITVALPLVIGDSVAGLRRVINITGGAVAGPRLNGRVLAGGADTQLIRADGLTEIDARYVIEADDGALISVENIGLRHGPPELMARIQRGEHVDPALIYFRTAPRFETGAPAHVWMTRALFVAKAARFPQRVEISVFEVG